MRDITTWSVIVSINICESMQIGLFTVGMCEKQMHAKMSHAQYKLHATEIVV